MSKLDILRCSKKGEYKYMGTDKLASVISMQRAVQLLGIRIYGMSSDSDLVPTDVSQINIMCPCCGDAHTSRRLTMNIDFEKNAFGCPRCSFRGGVYKLISKYTGWKYDEVEARVKAGELGRFTPLTGDGSEDGRQAEDIGRPIAPLKQRHEVYSAMLDLLKLNDMHRADLMRRGLSEDAIERIGFKTYPKYMDPTVIPKKLIAAGLDLRGVPGFGINNAGEWSLAKLPDGGFFIPSRNGRQMIFGCQVRFDHPNARIPKFGYLASLGMPGGTKASTWWSWAGANIADRPENTPFDVILIEGPLKAYIVHELTGCNVIAVPGVSALKKIPVALQDMIPMGLRCVYIAYDMDQKENVQVANALVRLRGILDSLQIKHETLSWTAEYKGLDDWIVGPEFAEFRQH